jgi:pimeloyl-ACP methyl ester carboxylesterase
MVPGARLYYEVSGSGPVLLLIPGGAADADIFTTVVDPLAEHYTVVRYDPRGISRSTREGPAEDVPVEVHADDARRVLLAAGSEPAYVLGSSGGAVIGLALAERFPERVRTLVAHEPPLLTLLPEASRRRRSGQEIYDTYRREGAGAAIQKFLAVTGMGGSGPRQEPTPEMQEAVARMQQNVEFFLAHYMLPITGYVPDIARLRAGAPHVIVGIGEASGGQLAHDTALALADRLGTEAVVFPGDHGGYMSDPHAFAAKLREVFEAD